MKRIIRSLAVIGLVSIVSFTSLNAQRASFHLAGGVVLPNGEFGDNFGTGWQGLGGVSFALGSVPFAIRVDGFYGQNNGDEDVVGPDVKVKLFGGLIGGQYNFGSETSSVKPYILVQGGMVNSKVDVPGQNISGETDLTVAGGGGVQFGLGSINAFVETQYVVVMTEDESSKYIPVRLGVRFGGGM